MRFTSSLTPSYRKLTPSYRNTPRLPVAAKVALWGIGALAVSGALTQYLSRRAEAHHRPRGKLLRIGDATVHLVDRGSGPPVVVLHGNGSMVEDPLSSGLIELLAERHRVVALDRPGFGLSDRDTSVEWTPEREARELARIIRALDLQRPVIVGHSWSTLVALSLALDEPDLISGLVLLSGYYYPTTRADVVVQSVISLPVVGDLIRHTVLPLYARLAAPGAFRKMFSPLDPPEEFLRQYSVPMATRPSQLRSVADDTANMPASAARLGQRYAELQLPIELIAGSEDKVVSTPHQSERLQKALVNSSLEIVQGAGHMIHHAHPRLVERKVRAVFDRAPRTVAPQEAKSAV
jgi:pimeloyl-ACP methyl ester carboxylesterase